MGEERKESGEPVPDIFLAYWMIHFEGMHAACNLHTIGRFTREKSFYYFMDTGWCFYHNS